MPGPQFAHLELVRVKCLSQGHVTTSDGRTWGIKLLIFQLDSLLNHSCQALGGNIFAHQLTMKPVITGPSCIVSSQHINWSGWKKRGSFVRPRHYAPTHLSGPYSSHDGSHISRKCVLVFDGEQIYCHTKYLWQEECSAGGMRLNIDLSCLLDQWHQCHIRDPSSTVPPEVVFLVSG